MDNECELLQRPPMCRLCLRIYYNREQLVDIFDEESPHVETIFDAVSVEPHREDPTTYLCVHCRTIVLLIKNFKDACLQSDIVLKNTPCAIQSESWSILDEVDIFQQAAKLVEMHHRDIHAIARKEDSKWVLETSPSAKKSPERVTKTECVSELIKEELVEPEDVTDEIKVEQPEDETLDVHSESVASEEQVTNDETTVPRKRRRRAKSDNKKYKPDKPEKAVCSYCGELVSQQVFEGHLNRHIGLQQFVCDIEGCNAKLYSRYDVRQHRSRHKSKNRYYDCNVCGKRIKGAPNWLMHRKLHTEEPRYPCDICGKKFRQKYKLKVHSTVHSGIAEFPCEICGKYFTVKHNRDTHFKLHMKNGTT